MTGAIKPSNDTSTASALATAAGYVPKMWDRATIRHIDNSCGDRDILYSLAIWTGKAWMRFDSNPDATGGAILEYKGDEILQIWPLTDDRAFPSHNNEH